MFRCTGLLLLLVVHDPSTFGRTDPSTFGRTDPSTGL
jgi:hypothetical protein